VRSTPSSSTWQAGDEEAKGHALEVQEHHVGKILRELLELKPESETFKPKRLFLMR
jgi:hypothetical protein